MSRRRVAIIAAAVVALVAGTCIGARTWIIRQAIELKPALDSAAVAGHAFGQTASAEQCLDEQARRVRVSGLSIAKAAIAREFLEGCLQSAQDVDAVCPSGTDYGVMAQARWSVRLCIVRGIPGEYCSSLVTPLFDACERLRRERGV